MADDLRIQENVALAPLTTLQVGGAARFFVEARTEDEIIAALYFAEMRDLPVFVLSGGSNLLIADNGFDGLIIKIAVGGIKFYRNKTNVFARAAAGENWDNFVSLCVARNLAGVECLSGIPGSVGAAPVQNVGAYGQEVAETISSVRVIDRRTKKIKTLTNAECCFAYRSSIFNTVHKNKFIILAVTFRFDPNATVKLTYPDLKRFFAEKEEPSLAEVRTAVLTVRAVKSMIITDQDENRRSAGSFFKNPVVDAKKFAEIGAIARHLSLISSDQNIPNYPTNNGNIKIPAAWLIEKSGFTKGFVRGRVGISTNHTLAIINCGGATANDVIEFVQEIQIQIKKIFGIDLQPEPIWLGFG